MNAGSHANLSRTCEVIEIPSGAISTLAEGTPVRIMQSRGDSYTVWTDYGQMYRIHGKDADAIGVQPAPEKAPVPQDTREFNESMVWDLLRTVYDPEIPVNIVDLGLIYSCKITPLEQDSRKVDIQMSMTAPGCGMGNVLKTDVESRISGLPSIKEVHVEVVFDPPWDMSRMSEAARLQLGF
jgi:probable FeS assembly SUF system protein SufT